MLSKILFFSVCLISLFAFIVADTAQDRPGICVNPKDGKEYNPGESWVSHGGECMKYICEESGAIGALTCPQVQVPDGFHLTEEDYSKRYPKCCSQIVKDPSPLLKLLKKLF